VQKANKDSHSSLIVNRHRLEPSAKARQIAEVKCNPKGDSPLSSIDRSSPYVRRTAKDGSNLSTGPTSSSRSTIPQYPLVSDRSTPPIANETSHPEHLKLACTFVDSVISLCSKSARSRTEMSEPVPDEDMFLLLVRSCGVAEAKLWANVLGLPCNRSYSLFQALLNGPKGNPHP
jgi:hypothetical protein